MNNKNKTFRKRFDSVVLRNYHRTEFFGFFCYIPVRPLKCTTIHVTVIIAAIVLGIFNGAIVGGVWVITFIRRRANESFW